jgi:hypothetical protein
MKDLQELLNNHFVTGLGLMLVGLLAGWLLGYWRRRRLFKQMRGGDIRELLGAEQILIREHPDGRTTMRIRSLGASAVSQVLLNPIGQETFLKRARATTSTNPLINMSDQLGSYLLHLLQPWVCGLARSGRFAHDVWIMAPVCEPGLLSSHHSATVILVRQSDLKRFRDWEWCKRLQVEHGSDGARVLTLWHMAIEFDRQLEEVRRLRESKQSSRYVETMYILDLGLDVEEMPLPTKPIPWNRFASVLKELKLG